VLCSKCAASLPDASHFCLKCGQPVSTAVGSAAAAPTAVLLGCSGCGETLPDGAIFCPKCGKPVSSPAKASAARSDTVVEVLPPETPRSRRPRRRVLLWLLLALLLAAIAWVVASDNPFAQGIQEIAGWKHDQTILENPFSVSAHSFRYYKFSLPEGSLNVAIVGQFTAASDASAANRREKEKEKEKDPDNAIEVYVLSEPAFTVWQNGYATSSVYESGRVTQGAMQAELPAGAGIYYLVFNNKFAPVTPKAIHATVLLRYKSWLPEWFRRMKDRFWNWIGV